MFAGAFIRNSYLVDKENKVYRNDFPKIVGKIIHNGEQSRDVFLAFYKGEIQQIYRFDNDKNYYIDANIFSLKEKEYKKIKDYKVVNDNFYQKIIPEKK